MNVVIIVLVDAFGVAGEDACKNGGCLGKHVRRDPELQDRLAISRLRVDVGKFKNGIAMRRDDNFLNLAIGRDARLARLYKAADFDQILLDSLVVSESDLVARELPMSVTGARSSHGVKSDVRIEDQRT